MVEEKDDFAKVAYLNRALKERGQNFSGEKEGELDQDLQEACVWVRETQAIFTFCFAFCLQAVAWMAERTDDEVMAQREATMRAIEQLAEETMKSGQKMAW